MPCRERAKEGRMPRSVDRRGALPALARTYPVVPLGTGSFRWQGAQRRPEGWPPGPPPRCGHPAYSGKKAGCTGLQPLARRWRDASAGWAVEAARVVLPVVEGTLSGCVCQTVVAGGPAGGSCPPIAVARGVDAGSRSAPANAKTPVAGTAHRFSPALYPRARRSLLRGITPPPPYPPRAACTCAARPRLARSGTR